MLRLKIKMADDSNENERSSSEHESDNSDVEDILDLLESSSSESDDDKDDKKSRGQSEKREYDDKVDRPLSDLVRNTVKSYRNTAGGNFVTGVDVTSREAKTKRENRAKRFGLEKDDASSDVEDISNIVLPPGSKIDGVEVRSEAIYIQGVDDMSTKDIFNYFKDYYPSSVEWINDTSCNVVWLDAQSAARALAGLSHARSAPSKEKAPVSNKDADPEPMEEDPRDEDEDALCVVSDKETGETERISRISPPPDSRETTQDSLSLPLTESEDSVQAMECLEMVEADMRPVNIKSEEALRIGKPNPKADELLLRFATHDDRKQKGAYKFSQYYIKYGNPSFGGMKGLISQSKRRQIREGKYDPSNRRKRRYENEEDDDDEEEEDDRSSYPNKRHNHGDADDEHREERRDNPKDLRERLSRSHRHTSSPKPSQSSGSEEREADDDDDDDLDAQLQHAIGMRSPPKRARQMYADDIEEKLKQIRKESGLSQSINKIRDARDRISGRSGLLLKDRLGHIHGAPTPAPSLENLKVIVDINDDESDKQSEKSSEEDEEESEDTSEKDYHSIRRKGSDLRNYLHNREITRKLLDTYPSLQIEVQDDA